MSQTTLIPKPSGRISSLRSAMGLAEDDPRFADTTARLRQVCNDLFDIGFSWKDQDPISRDRYIKRAEHACPLVQEYENMWPAIFYARKYLKTRTYNSKLNKTWTSNKAKASNSSPQDVINIDYSDQANQDTETAPNEPQSSHRRTTRVPSRVPLQVMASSRSKSPPSTRVTRLAAKAVVAQRPQSTASLKMDGVVLTTRKKPSSTSSSSSSASSSSTVSAKSIPDATTSASSYSATPSSTELAGFLNALVGPSLAALAPRLAEAGVADPACFRLLVQWPDSERGAFLREDARLNPFQQRLVRVALERLQITEGVKQR